MIKSFRTNKSFYNLQFNYRVSDVIIPIAMSLDDGYTYPTIVAMTSILENTNLNTNMIFIFYIQQISLLQVKRNLNFLKKNI